MPFEVTEMQRFSLGSAVTCHRFSLEEWQGRPARESRARCACHKQTEPVPKISLR